MFTFAGIQLKVTEDKDTNIQNAAKSIGSAVASGASVISLPECFNSPYSNDAFPDYAESIPDGPTSKFLSAEAKKHEIFLIGGSIPERDTEGNIYNTCAVFNPAGTMIAKHRKLHLFDVNVPGKISFQESKTLSAGDGLTLFSTGKCTIGIGICYDIRFPELSQLYAEKGADFLCFPGAFNTTTGPAHWELLLRARAVDNQLFVAGVAPARNVTEKYTYPAWGHTSVVSPWGEVIGTTDENPAVVLATIDLAKVQEMRSSIPTREQKRKDLYELRSVKS